MIEHKEITPFELFSSLKQQKIQWAGNKNLKIYGTLSCKSGKRLKVENRVFFCSDKDAIKEGYRPCGHCMREEYKVWKNNTLIFRV
ncbi:metal-binding protein [Flagellimonas hymeniacidonis]|uniref:Metal-binding protein n=1 Tax=Flagellimonas hymeniacidonis TaxID=2603628 RepID=A0A5C8V675_9FLAO|nr:Ada metal-binding domain-containing protein [Flagellimonas hymeniacidonis]TXN37365.1 metal-binding protein [Flagellimonas hymeniacidonis]